MKRTSKPVNSKKYPMKEARIAAATALQRYSDAANARTEVNPDCRSDPSTNPNCHPNANSTRTGARSLIGTVSYTYGLPSKAVAHPAWHIPPPAWPAV